MSELDAMMKDLRRVFETGKEKERQHFARKWAGKMGILAKALDEMKKKQGVMR